MESPKSGLKYGLYDSLAVTLVQALIFLKSWNIHLKVMGETYRLPKIALQMEDNVQCSTQRLQLCYQHGSDSAFNGVTSQRLHCKLKT